MQIVGSLLYLSTRSRPDLSFRTNYLTIICHHLHIAYKILRYLSNTKSYQLQFNGQWINFNDMVDSSYVSHVDRKSHFGITVHLNSVSGSCITVSKKGKLLTLSSTDHWHLNLLCGFASLLELGYPPSNPTILYEDNKSAIHMVDNGNGYQISFYVRDLVKD